MTLKWKQVGNDYELYCACCKQRIAIIYKDNFTYVGNVMMHETEVATGNSFQAVRKLVNAHIEELLNDN